MVERLLELGHLALVVRAAGERGEWFCATAAVRELCAAGDFEGAWAVIRPFAATGWEPAVTLSAEVLFRWGRTEEALALVHPGEVVREGREWRDFALMLARAGRVDEAIATLIPHTEDWWLLETLVEMTEGQGRDEQVLDLLAPLAQEAGRAGTEGTCCYSPRNAQELRAQVLERAGRVDEAIRVLGADVATGHRCLTNTLTCYAELLARHGRIEELRALGTGEHADTVLHHYTRALEDAGRAEEAEALLREFTDADTNAYGHHHGTLVGLLSRQGRIDEAVEAGRPTFSHWDGGNLLAQVIHLLVGDGRPERALELLDEPGAEYLEEYAWWVRPTRLWLLGEAGRAEEAIGLLRASTGSRATLELADLLIGQGRPEEAVAALPSVSAEREEAERRRRTAPDDMDLLFEQLLAVQERHAQES